MTTSVKVQVHDPKAFRAVIKQDGYPDIVLDDSAEITIPQGGSVYISDEPLGRKTVKPAAKARRK